MAATITKTFILHDPAAYPLPLQASEEINSTRDTIPTKNAGTKQSPHK